VKTKVEKKESHQVNQAKERPLYAGPEKAAKRLLIP
jgi:hypothetical protein